MDKEIAWCFDPPLSWAFLIWDKYWFSQEINTQNMKTPRIWFPRLGETKRGTKPRNPFGFGAERNLIQPRNVESTSLQWTSHGWLATQNKEQNYQKKRKKRKNKSTKISFNFWSINPCSFLVIWIKEVWANRSLAYARRKPAKTKLYSFNGKVQGMTHKYMDFLTGNCGFEEKMLKKKTQRGSVCSFKLCEVGEMKQKEKKMEKEKGEWGHSDLVYPYIFF